jgi:hypothetical protein
MSNHESLVSGKVSYSLGLDKTNGWLEKIVVPGGYGELCVKHPASIPLAFANGYSDGSNQEGYEDR